MKRIIKTLMIVCMITTLFACSNGSSKLDSASKGDVVKFGSAEYTVLDTTDDSLLIMAVNGLDKMPLHEESLQVTWENCTLRKYLNEDFYNTLSDEEKEMVQTVTLENSDNEEYGSKGGNDTEDKVFVLSSKELNTYFASNEERASSVAYWTRTPGFLSTSFTYVTIDGTVELFGSEVSGVSYTVRPAMWIKVK